MLDIKSHKCLAAAIMIVTAWWCGNAQAAIMPVNSGKFGGDHTVAVPTTMTQSVTVGAAADMLIVTTSSELGGLTSPALSVTYGGVSMTKATGNNDLSSIWYLDLSTPGISGTNISVNMSGYATRNGMAVGWVSIDGEGEQIVLHNTASSTNSKAIALTTTVETFNVVAFNGNDNDGVSPLTVVAPNPTVIYTDTNIGSAFAAAAYEGGVAAGTHNYSWSAFNGSTEVGNGGNPGYRRIDAAAFELIPEPASIVLIALGGMLMLPRRRQA